MTNKYRRDGTPYPDTKEGLLEWAHDFEKPRHVGDSRTADGWRRVSTVWLGLDHNFWKGRPLIFETAVFDESDMHYSESMGRSFPRCDVMARYSTEAEALAGHNSIVDGINTTWNWWVLGILCSLYALVGLWP